MLQFVHGRAGSGKTTYVHQILAEFAKSGYEDLLLIVPEQFSFSAERAILNLLGPVNSNKVEIVMSMTHIADCVFKEYGSAHLPFLDDAGKAAVMSMALESVSDHLDVFAKQKKSLSLLKEMLDLSSTFIESDINQEDLRQMSNFTDSPFLKKKLGEISLILSSYNALIENNYFDPMSQLTLLYHVLDEYKYFENKIVVIDGFHGFSQQEYKVIEKILVQSKEAYVTLCTDSLYQNDETFDSFSYVKKTAKKIREIANRHSIKVAKPINLSKNESSFKRFGNKELEVLEKNLYLPVHDTFNDKTENIKLIQAKNIHDECDFVACAIKKFLRSGKYRCRDIAVMSNNENEYNSAIKSSLKKYDIDVFVDKRQEIYTQPLVVLVDSIFDVLSSNFSTEYILKYIKTGLISIDFESLSELENYVLMWNITNKKWLNVWDECPSGLGREMTERDYKQLKNLNEMRESIVQPLLRLKETIGSSCKGENLAKGIYYHLIKIKADKNLKEIAIELDESGETELALQQENIWDLMMDILDLLAKINHDVSKDLKSWHNLYNIIISEYTLGNIPQGLDEVLIGSVERSRLTSPKIVFVLGANSGVFPKTIEEKGIFSNKELKVLENMGFELGEKIENKLLYQRFLAYNALCSAKDYLFVSYPEMSLTGEELTSSEVIFQLKSIFTNLTTVETQNLSHKHWIESRKTAFEALAMKYKDNDELSEGLKNYLISDLYYSDKLKTLDAIHKGKDFEITDKEIAKRVFSKDFYLSPSSIEEYFKCPFKYFCKFALKAKPRETAQLDSRQRGIVIHYAFEKLVKEYGINQLSSFSDNELKSEINQVIEDYASTNMGGLDGKDNRFVFLYSRFNEIVFELIKRLIDEFSHTDFEPVDFELKIDRDSEIKPYEIVLESGNKILVRGSIDRVDKFEKDGTSYIRVVDYKTGGKDFTLSDVLSGLNMQMLIYLFSLWKNGEKKYGNVMPSGVLYMPSKIDYPKLNFDIENNELKKEKNKKMKQAGLLLDNFDSLTAMDKNRENFYLPITYKKDGVTGNILSYEDFGLLRDKVDSLLKEMGDGLKNGRIPALPAQSAVGDKYVRCQYCDFKSVCCNEDTEKVKLIEKISFDDAIKILREGEQESVKDEMD